MKVQKHHPEHVAKSAVTASKSDEQTRNGCSGQEVGRDKCQEEVHIYAERGAEVAVHRELVDNTKVQKLS